MQLPAVLIHAFKDGKFELYKQLSLARALCGAPTRLCSVKSLIDKLVGCWIESACGIALSSAPHPHTPPPLAPNNYEALAHG